MSGAADTHLLDKARNFRAVKPYPAADGQVLRANTLFRSGELSRLDAVDLARLQGFGIRLVCDLRSAPEQAEYVSRWPDGSVHRQLDLPEKDQSDTGSVNIFRVIAQEPGEPGGASAMLGLYRRKPRAWAANLRALFGAVLAGDALPLLVHCHAGKDRTGFIVAMFLAAAGVSRSHIFEDYELTARFFPLEEETQRLVGWAERAFGEVLDHDAARAMVAARRDYLAAAFAEIETGWGGVDRYLAEAVGLDAAALTKFRDLLLA